MRSLEVDMAMDLTLLTQQTGAGPTCDIPTHVGPAEIVTDEAAGCTYTWMIYAVQVRKNLVSKGGGHERTENTGGNVAEQFCSFNIANNNF
jgi:hypothetical protein